MTTKPVSPTVAPTIVVSTVSAVLGVYVQPCGASPCASIQTTPEAEPAADQAAERAARPRGCPSRTGGCGTRRSSTGADGSPRAMLRTRAAVARFADRRTAPGTIGRMCRWLAYSGSPLRLDELLLNRTRSLVDQSLHSQLGRDDDERRRLRRRLVRRRRPSRASTAAPTRPGTTATCASSPRASSRRSSSRTSAPRRGRRSRRRTRTPSGTAAGCGCTTARSAATTR